MQKKADIYHKDHVPPLARRSKGRRKIPSPPMDDGERRMARPRFADESPKERIPFDGFHMDGSLPRRCRKRRKSSKHENRAGMFLAIGLTALLVVYAGAWTAYEIFWNRTSAPTAATPTPEADAPVAAPAPLTVDVKELITNVRKAKDLIDGAANHSEKEDYQAAIRSLNKALEKLPNHLPTMMLLARNHYMAKEYEPSTALLHNVLSEEPDNLPARLLLGQSLGKSGHFTEAIEVANWALKGDPYMTDAHVLAAMSYKAIGKTPSSISHLRKAYNMKSDDVFIGNELALSYAEIGSFDRALEVFNSLMNQSRVDSVTYFNLATCYAQNQMPEKVVEILLEAGEQFGRGYINSWVRSEKFDPVRTDPDFIEFLTADKQPKFRDHPTSG